MLLSGLFLALVLINGAFKYRINTLKGRLGERMLRRLRYELYARVLRFPLPRFRKVSQGEIIPMITAEVEPLGGFIGDHSAAGVPGRHAAGLSRLHLRAGPDPLGRPPQYRSILRDG